MIRRKGVHYTEPFAIWLRIQIAKRRAAILSKKFNITESLLYKYAAGEFFPSMKHFDLYKEFMLQTGTKREREVASVK